MQWREEGGSATTKRERERERGRFVGRGRGEGQQQRDKAMRDGGLEESWESIETMSSPPLSRMRFVLRVGVDMLPTPCSRAIVQRGRLRRPFIGLTSLVCACWM
jgi:hypothetical protein